MLVWGSKVGITDLGPQGSKHCPTCEKERSFRLILRYKISHLWYVIKWVSEKRYGVACEVCNRGDDLVTQAVEAKLGKPEIPTTRSRAWIAVVAAIACLLVLGLWGRPERVERMNSLLASPQKSDLYVVNLSSLLKSPQSLGMYGILRVRSVAGERVDFDTPIVAYDKVTGANKDLRSGKLADPGYFSGDPLALSRGELADLKRHGALHSIERP